MSENEKESEDLVTKRLATGEVAVWDSTKRLMYIVNEKQESLKIVRGSTLKEIEKKLGHIVVLV
jgi:hypothetical protein